MRLLATALVMVAGSIGLPGCDMATARPPAEQGGAMAPMVWPAPPQQARIRLVGAIARPADLGVPPSIWQRIGDFIVGTKEEGFVRPTGVAATDRTIFVADAGAPALWIVDRGAGRFRKIRRGTGETLMSPVSVALAPPDRILVADSYRAKIFVFHLDGRPAGVIAETGFRRPAGVAYDAARDRLYVADSGAHRVWVMGADGQLRGAIGERGTGPAEFNFPTHVAVDPEGRLFVTDALGFRVQWFTQEGRFLGSFGRQGDASGDLASPKGVAVDSEGHVYVVDALFDAVQIFGGRGQLLLAFGERGSAPGRFWLPGGIFIDGRDRIYVADSYNRRIQIFDYLRGDGDD